MYIHIVYTALVKAFKLIYHHDRYLMFSLHFIIRVNNINIE